MVAFSHKGIAGGKFLERGRIKKPPEVKFSTEVSQNYTAADLYIGACVLFNKFKFVILDADEYALKFMEDNSNLVSPTISDVWVFFLWIFLLYIIK